MAATPLAEFLTSHKNIQKLPDQDLFSRLQRAAWGKPLKELIRLQPILRPQKKEDKVKEPGWEGPLPKSCLVLDNFSLELTSAHPKYHGLLVRREWADAAEALHAYAADPDFAMRYFFYTERGAESEEILKHAEEDGLEVRFNEEWIEDAPPLLTKVPPNPFLKGTTTDVGGGVNAVGACVIGQWACGSTSLRPSSYGVSLNNGAYVISNLNKRFCRYFAEVLPNSTFSLVDSNDAVTVPDYLVSLGAFILHAGKMNTASIEWLESVGGGRPCTRYYMKKWSAYELLAARMLHPHVEVTEKWLCEAADMYGHSAGMACVAPASDNRDLDADTRLAMHSIRDMDDFKKMMMRGIQHDFSLPAAYRLVSVAPDTLTDNRRNKLSVEQPTKHVFRMLWDSPVFKSREQMQLEALLKMMG
ncbi:hypothetical protein EUX98_g6021 [Antrodiella citrinella]|uniref:Uncharacterized protein n=1 Tax=Antrodiella citrinella TaxID=2447956 RepID=A0A4S4MR10_9APHY|nr:hypothetical protein EUX98_g6021 [Antrodiella citrinella]